MGGVTALRGVKQQLAHMTAKDRLPFSALYLASMLATLWAATVLRSYALCVACSLVQLLALTYYIFSHFPGGVAGLKIVGMGVGRALHRASAGASKEASAALSSVLPPTV